ncbi:zinc-ribbon domain-containing protein [Jannaschia rubra]|uniref:Family finger-like domain protein n=1 Tax=Jannaschia rubra TaxID=282197 RepID=A0A0M6XNN8_9RHOB|nr:zinc-ribbon domain-containing protein [Jannaschia rubra]CTQ32292.1 family finger-like domain protein [Jannaschia rubra]SFG47963.1 MJ0042 family finger-like domain-containing protein [Jannaschia rubra]
MRITCPNCNAQYEIGEDLIPAEGRDVQCSNCGTMWFLEGRARIASPAPERPVRRAVAPPPEDEMEDRPAPAPERRRPVPDDRTLEILREEREREERLRAEPTPAQEPEPRPEPAPEQQLPEPDLEHDARQVAAAERTRMAAAAALVRTREEARDRAGPMAPEPAADDGMADAIATTMRDATADPEDDAPAAPPRQTRRELLPDIEEINSSLRPDERAAEARAGTNVDDGDDGPMAYADSGWRRGFRTGFLLTVFVVLTMVAFYVFAPRIALSVPSIEPALTDYVAWVDMQRIALAAGVEALTASIDAQR